MLCTFFSRGNKVEKIVFFLNTTFCTFWNSTEHCSQRSAINCTILEAIGCENLTRQRSVSTGKELLLLIMDLSPALKSAHLFPHCDGKQHAPIG